jgi:hypothetical protein
MPQSEEPGSTREPGSLPNLTIDELRTTQETLRLLAVKCWRSDEPLWPSDVLEIAQAWMSTRTTPALGILACDMAQRPIACAVLAPGLADLPHADLIQCVRYCVEQSVVRPALVVNDPDRTVDLQAVADAAAELNDFLNPFDAKLVDAFVIPPDRVAISLRERGLFRMNPVDIFAAFRNRKEKEVKETAASRASIARKYIEGRPCTKAEAALLEDGRVTEEQVKADAALIQRTQPKIQNDVRSIKKDRIRRPQVEAARAELPGPLKRVEELHGLIAGGYGWGLDPSPIVAVCSECPELFPEFQSSDGSIDPKLITAHCTKLVDAEPAPTQPDPLPSAA